MGRFKKVWQSHSRLRENHFCRRDEREGRERQDGLIWFIWFVLFVWLVFFNQRNQINKRNKLAFALHTPRLVALADLATACLFINFGCFATNLPPVLVPCGHDGGTPQSVVGISRLTDLGVCPKTRRHSPLRMALAQPQSQGFTFLDNHVRVAVLWHGSTSGDQGLQCCTWSLNLRCRYS